MNILSNFAKISNWCGITFSSGEAYGFGLNSP